MITHMLDGNGKRIFVASLALAATSLLIALVAAFALAPAFAGDPEGPRSATLQQQAQSEGDGASEATGTAVLQEPSQAETGETGGKGGGGEPPGRLVAVYNSLPVPVGAKTWGPPGSTGIELESSYLMDDSPMQVMVFYERELVKAGWQQPAPTVLSFEDPQKGSSVAYTARFIKDDLQLEMMVKENSKDPTLGKTWLWIRIQPR